MGAIPDPLGGHRRDGAIAGNRRLCLQDRLPGSQGDLPALRVHGEELDLSARRSYFVLDNTYKYTYNLFMRQLTIYIDSETERRIKMAARSVGLSLSKWIATLVRERTEKVWPQSITRLAGAWPDLPTVEDIRRLEAADTQREHL